MPSVKDKTQMTCNIFHCLSLAYFFLKRNSHSHLWQEKKSCFFFVFFLPQLLGVSLEGFLSAVKRKKEARLYRNEIRQIFTAFDVHCKCL